MHLPFFYGIFSELHNIYPGVVAKSISGKHFRPFDFLLRRLLHCVCNDDLFVRHCEKSRRLSGYGILSVPIADRVNTND